MTQTPQPPAKPGRFNLLTVYNADKNDIFAGGTLVTILAEQKTGWTSVTWANGYHHLRGFYFVQWIPGMWQGFVSFSLLTVLPSDVAMAD